MSQIFGSTENKDSIYVLKLEQEKWYIGRSANVERRYEQHMNGTASQWTFLHKPIEIVLQRPIKSDNDEDEMTREYMIKYGIFNVRGGSYCEVELKPWNIKEINRDIEAEKSRKKIKELTDKLSNEIFNSNSDLRSGRWVRGLLGLKIETKPQQ